MPDGDTVRQHFCAFLALLGPDDDERFDRALAALPRYRPDGREVRRPGLRLVFFPGEGSALHRTILIEEEGRVLLLQGDFYREPPEGRLRALLALPTLEVARLGQTLAETSGAFSGVLALPDQGSCLCFTDQFGFSFAYYARDGERTWAASSIWPLLRARPGGGRVSAASVQDTVLLGYPTGDRTILESVAMVQPGRIASVGPREKVVFRYAQPHARREQTMAQALEQFSAAFRAHFGYVSRQIGPERFVSTITGGHDTRVVLNAALLSGIRPRCVTGSDDPAWPTEDAMRAMRVAAAAGCEREIVAYTRPSPEHGADAFFLSEGGGTGLWMATLAEACAPHGDALYCGFTGDVLSGSPESVSPHHHAQLDSLARAVFFSNYEYRTDAATLCAELLGVRLDDVLERYAATFAPYRALDRRDAFVYQNLDNRNVRRIAYFAAAIKIYMPAVSLYHDADVARAYLELPQHLLADERLHRRLCSLAVPELARIPANQWMVPMALEPLFWNYVRGPAKRAYPLLQAARGRLRRGGPPAPAQLDERYEPALEALGYAGVLDVDAARRALAGEPYGGRGHILAFRIEQLARSVLFAKGSVIPQELGARLFRPAAALTPA